jgi:hypothetical protein
MWSAVGLEGEKWKEREWTGLSVRNVEFRVKLDALQKRMLNTSYMYTGVMQE